LAVHVVTPICLLLYSFAFTGTAEEIAALQANTSLGNHF